MLSWKWIAPVVIALAIVLAVNVATPKSAEAEIHEIIAALCNGGGHVEPPGQVTAGKNSFLRALQATGVIESIVTVDPDGDGDDVQVNFDLSKRNSKYVDGSGGEVFIIEDFFGTGMDLRLNPLPVFDPNFPAHANCKNLNP